jgi:transcriptional regulator with XRE-family HTH domain
MAYLPPIAYIDPMFALAYPVGMAPLILRLREWRERRGLTQKQLAEAAGIRRATVSDMERGIPGGVDFETLLKLCTALDASPADLFPDKPCAPRGRRRAT